MSQPSGPDETLEPQALTPTPKGDLRQFLSFVLNGAILDPREDPAEQAVFVAADRVASECHLQSMKSPINAEAQVVRMVDAALAEGHRISTTGSLAAGAEIRQKALDCRFEVR